MTLTNEAVRSPQRAPGAAGTTAGTLPEQRAAAPARFPQHHPGAGWIARRDGVLLLLQRAGLSCRDVAQLRARDVTVADGTAVIGLPGRVIRVESTEHRPDCGPCELARWLHVLDMVASYRKRWIVTALINRAAAPATNWPHACRGIAVGPATHDLPLLPPVDPWGLLPTPARDDLDTQTDAYVRELEELSRELLHR